jgi:hypothetical protein
LAAAAAAAVVAAGLVAAAVVAVVHRSAGPWGGGATLRPLAADESMTDEQAYAVADNTFRLWVREIDAANLPNVLALTCPSPAPGWLPLAVGALQNVGAPPERWLVQGTGNFVRNGDNWSMSVFVDRGVQGFGMVATVQVASGEARLCGLQNAPVPPAK